MVCNAHAYNTMDLKTSSLREYYNYVLFVLFLNDCFVGCALCNSKKLKIISSILITLHHLPISTILIDPDQIIF